VSKRKHSLIAIERYLKGTTVFIINFIFQNVNSNLLNSSKFVHKAAYWLNSNIWWTLVFTM